MKNLTAEEAIKEYGDCVLKFTEFYKGGHFKLKEKGFIITGFLEAGDGYHFDNEKVFYDIDNPWDETVKENLCSQWSSLVIEKDGKELFDLGNCE